MPPFQRKSIHRGFSLIELLIVIIIISVVYFLGFSGMEKSNQKTKALTPLTLKSAIMNSEIYQGEGTFMCIDKCRSCYLRKSIDTPYEAYEGAVNLKNIEAYTLDANDALLKMEYGRYQDKKICLLLHFYNNGSSTQIILKQNNNVFFLPAFFGEAQSVDSLEEAKTLWIGKYQALTNKGNYY